jgi:predicted dehydrogenase
MAAEAGKKLGIGVVGLGWVTNEHIKGWLKDKRCEIVAISSHDRDNALAFQRKYGLQGARIYTDWEDLMRDERVDAVDVCSMNHMHVPQGIAAAESGKHVMLEKPAAVDLEGLRRLEAAMDKAGVKRMVAFVLRWSPYFESVRQMIAGDFFGKLFFAECDYYSGNWDKWLEGLKWIMTKEKGGSALITAGCHAVDALRGFVTADPVEVFAYSANFSKVMEWDPTVITTIKFADGTLGRHACILEGNCNYQFDVRLHGPKGMLINEKFMTHHIPGQTDLASFPTIMANTPNVEHYPFDKEVSHFATCILENKVPLTDLRDSVKTHEICLAAEISAREGKPVTLPLA